VAPASRDALAALQHASGLDLLDARLAADGALRSVSFLPALSRYGDVGLDALHKSLMTRSGVGR
jgi:hypothetical protein